MELIKLTTLTCLRCRWTWTPRIKQVRQCANPACRSPRWDLPRPQARRRSIRRRGEQPSSAKPTALQQLRSSVGDHGLREEKGNGCT